MGIIKLCIKSLESNNFDKESTVSVWGEIYVDIDGKAFPSEGWYDVVSSMVDMWTDSVVSFMQSNDSNGCTLYFMDGPYKIVLKWISSDEIKISMFKDNLETASHRCNVSDFLSAFTEGVTTFCRLCEHGNARFIKSRTFSRIVENRKNLIELA